MAGESLHDRVVGALGHQYKVEGEIGRGGMSVVYRARDLRLNRAVAIKVLPPELAHDPAVGSRFTREAQTSAQLSHPNIVPIYDVGERDGIAYFVMGLITGGNLAALIDRQPRRPVDEVRRLLAEIADALSYAHLRGVIHRDVKADNILLDADSGRSVVTDFGIARAVEGGSRLTLTGIAVGTPTYMSPEQAVGEREIDGRSDIYSLGILGYQMLTGRVPFIADNSMALLLKHVNERPRPIADLRPEAPKSLSDVIERALMKAPEDRWPTAAAMREALSWEESVASAWRLEHREPVRYISPVPRNARREVQPLFPAPMSPRRERDVAPPVAATAPMPELPTVLQHEPQQYAALSLEQRADLRLWGGRINLLDRIKAARRHALAVIAMTFLGGIGFAAGVEDIPPLVFSPLVPMYMWFKLWQRGGSLRGAGLKLRRVFFMPRSRMALPAPAAPAGQKELEKLVPREVLEGARGAAIRRAVDDRAAIAETMASLSKVDRAMLPDIEPTVNGLVDRVAHLAVMLHRLDDDFDPGLVAELDARIAHVANDGDSTDAQRRLALLRRQRDTIDELAQRHRALARQIDSAGLALGNLRLDLIKLRSSGIESALGDVSTATQEARVLSRDIGIALDAAAELRKL
jgi:serine/threonine protein kinase